MIGWCEFVEVGDHWPRFFDCKNAFSLTLHCGAVAGAHNSLRISRQVESTRNVSSYLSGFHRELFHSALFAVLGGVSAMPCHMHHGVTVPRHDTLLPTLVTPTQQPTRKRDDDGDDGFASATSLVTWSACRCFIHQCTFFKWCIGSLFIV